MKEYNKSNKLGDLIYEAREARGWSSQKVASIVGLHHSTMARIQLGQIRRPGADVLARIADALELDRAELFALAGYRSESEMPSLSGWLNVKHRGLPPDAADALQSHLDYLLNKHGEDATSPESGWENL